MRHDRLGWWIREAGPPPAARALAGELEVDVVVVGGGFTGLWAAWHLLSLEPGVRVALLEANRCGLGPSGRNGGFVSSLDLGLPALRERLGVAGGDLVAGAARASVAAIGAWCAAEGVDAWYRAAPHLRVATAAAQDAALTAPDPRDAEWVGAVGPAAVGAVCASPAFRGGHVVAAGATVQPARLAFGLRERLLGRGVRVYEGTPVRAVRREGARAVVLTPGGRVRAGRVLLALGAASGTLRSLRGRLTVGSSHLLVTEPLPELLGSLGWTGGEAITDARTLLHYLRTTPDGRIVAGWAGGGIACGARLHGRSSSIRPRSPACGESSSSSPPSRAGLVAHAWGGPVDVTAAHLPAVLTLGGGAAFAARLHRQRRRPRPRDRPDDGRAGPRSPRPARSAAAPARSGGGVAAATARAAALGRRGARPRGARPRSGRRRPGGAGGARSRAHRTSGAVGNAARPLSGRPSPCGLPPETGSVPFAHAMDNH